MASKERARLVAVEQEERSQRAFEAWLTKKQEERKQYLMAQQQAKNAVNGQRMSEEKKMMSTRAYQQWLLHKQEEEQQRKKEQMIEQQFEVLRAEQRKANCDKAKATFLSWKKRKDFERRLCQETKRQTWNGTECVGSVEPTPTLPGYCSVWSCDEKLAKQLTARVHRTS